jgi:hypothetical protein
VVKVFSYPRYPLLYPVPFTPQMDRKETIDKIRAIKLGSSRLGEPRSIDIHGNENVTMRFLDIKGRDLKRCLSHLKRCLSPVDRGVGMRHRGRAPT